MKQRKQLFSLIAGLLGLAILSCSGAGGISNLFATDTPTATNTFTPSPTLTPSPTFTPTETPMPTEPSPSTGVSTNEQEDGSTVFTDHDNKYQLALPPGWIVIPLSSEDMADILQKVSEENPDFKDVAEAFKQLDPEVIRVMAINKDRKYVYKGFSTNLNVTAIAEKLLSAMPLDFVIGAIEGSVNQQGGQLLSSGSTFMNANGVEVGSFEFTQSAPTATGDNIPIRTKAILFQAGGKVIMIQLATPEQFGEELMPVMDAITDSIILIE